MTDLDANSLASNHAQQDRPETAGRLMTRRVLFAQPGETVGSLRKRIATEAHDLSDPIVAVDKKGHYRGVIRLDSVVRAEADHNADNLAIPEWPAVHASMDQEQVAELARMQGLVAIPVVAKSGRALGLVSAARLLDVLWSEHTEDVHRLAGIMKPLDEASYALDEPPASRAWRRLPWLLVGFAGTAIATALMASFEAMFAGNVRIAFFVPAIVYLADAIGAQTVAVAVRGLPIAHRPFWRLLRGEALAGIVIGLVLSVLAFLAVVAGFGDSRLAAAVAVAIFMAGTVATTVGLALPWLLARIGVDPAFGSGPVATIIQDVLSILIYVLAIAAILP